MAETPRADSSDRQASGNQTLAWHALGVEHVHERLGTPPKGLDTDEARQRQQEYGPNELPAPPRPGPFVRLLRQFHNILIYILIFAAIGTALLGHWVDTGVIAAVVVINGLIGFIQEGRAEQALESIQQMLSPKAVVLRDQRRQTLPASELVPGDIVYLQAGDRVPADLRLTEVKNLRIDEAILTGESVAAEKDLTANEPDTQLGDRTSMAFSGTLVAYGQGAGVVVGTGSDTEIGRISTLLGEVEELTTPLLRQVEQFGRWLSVVIVVIAAITFAFGYWVRDYPLAEIFLAAASLVVSTIPEGLPAIMTITLAIGVTRMARRNAIIRRLPAVETLGSVSNICSDKTGTLTRNEMTVRTIETADRPYEVTGVGYEPYGAFCADGREVAADDPDEELALYHALHAILLCNDAQLHVQDGHWQMEGDPTEGALVTAATKGGLDRKEANAFYPRTDVIPFESSYKFMATLHHDHEGSAWIYLKGAPEQVLAVCSRQRSRDGDVPLDPAHWDDAMDRIAAEGQRLLAVAVKRTEFHKRELIFDDVAGDMTLLAMCGIIDPPRDEAINAVRECREAGIRVKMITGDHAITARAIGEQLGIDPRGHVLTGRDVEHMDDAALRNAIQETHVFARTSPAHKLRLVEALQDRGQIVAMTGDGVNDAPALKRADVGVAMGRKGSEASKEASEMVLADDNFASIAHAVEEGRTVYDNIRKAILHMLPTNAGQSLTIMIAIFLGFTLPLTPVQVLWVNMVTSVTLAMSLAFLAAEPGVMRRPPRPPDQPLVSGFLLWRIAFVAVLLWAGTFGHFTLMVANGAEIDLARSVAINTLVAGQAFYLFNLRFVDGPVLNRAALKGSRYLWFAIGALILLQIVFTYAPPFQVLFGTTALTLDDWVRVIAFGAFVFAVVELEKFVRQGFGRRSSQ